MIPPQFATILERLQASRFSDLAGARLTASIPVSEGLLNAIVAASLPPSTTVRGVTLHPQPQDRLTVRVTLARLDFLPPISATLAIERQPELPDRPLLVCRVTGLPGLLTMAGPLLLGPKLPPGVRLEGDLVTVDLAALLAQHGQRDLLLYLERLRITTEAGRLLIDVTARVPDPT